MELRQLRYFIQVAELGSFSGAAKTQCITQSTISQQIKQLEDELDSPLFIRDSRHVVLTDVGQALLPQAKRTVAEAEKSLDTIRDIKGLASGILNIGSTYTFSLIMNEMVRGFISLYPGVKVNIKCKTEDELCDMLRNQEIDIAFGYSSADQSPDIDSHIIFNSQLRAVMSANHPLASHTSVTMQELSECVVALPAQGLQARSAFNKYIGDQAKQLNVQLEVNDLNMLLELVASSNMVTFLSLAAADRDKRLTAIPIVDMANPMTGCYLVKNGAYQSSAAREFMRLLDQTEPFHLA